MLILNQKHLKSNQYKGEYLFVKIYNQKGIGKQVIDFVKGIKEQMNLGVYQKNERTIKFFQRVGFVIISENIDHHINEKEYSMTWSQ